MSGWILFELVVFGIVIWFLGAYVSSNLAGWAVLSRQFSTRQPPIGGVLRNCILGIGSGPGLVNLLDPARTRRFGLFATADGLYLDAGSPGRFKWPPLLVAWTDVRLIATRNLLGKASYELRLGRSTAYVTVNQTAFEHISPFLQQAAATDSRREPLRGS
jgi:hypothetical protein